MSVWIDWRRPAGWLQWDPSALGPKETDAPEVVREANDRWATMEGLLRPMRNNECIFDRWCDTASIAHDEKSGPSYEHLHGLFRSEVIAYSLILAGDYRAATDKLRSLRAYIEKCKPPSSLALPRLLERDEYAARLQDALKQSTDRATALLNEWTEQTKRNLELP